MENKKNRGFTLIELLVVISIIGLLSSVILASLNSARLKGSDAAIKSNLNSSRPQAELFYNANNFSYDGGTAATRVCDTAGSATGVRGIYPHLIAAGTALGGTPVVGGNAQAFAYSSSNSGAAGAVVCHATSAGWAAMVSLKNVANNGWCVDSTGYSKEATVLGINSITCGS